VQPPPEDTFGVPIAKRQLKRMEYKADTQIHFVRTELTRFLKEVAGTITVQSQDQNTLQQAGKDMINPLLTALLDVAARLKHHGFQEEHEYRIATFTAPDFFDPSDIGLIPRVNIEFETSCVKEIMIGPGQHMETRESSVRAYFRGINKSTPEFRLAGQRHLLQADDLPVTRPHSIRYLGGQDPGRPMGR
jgi:hypothetical protein